MNSWRSRSLERSLMTPEPTGATELATRRGLSEGDLAAIRSFLAPLDRGASGLGAAAFDYIVGGDHASVLLEIPRRLSRASLATTLLLYSADAPSDRVFLALEGWDVAIARRLGEMLAVVDQQSGHPRLRAGQQRSPDFVCALARVTAGCLDHRPHAAPESWLLDGPRCLELLALEGADQAALVDVLFTRTEVEGRRQGPKRLLCMRGLPEVLAAAPKRTLLSARALAVEGRCRFIEFVGKSGIAAQPELLSFLLETVARGRKQESEAALAALTGCDRARLAEQVAPWLSSREAEDRRAAARVLVNTGTAEARSLLEQHLPRETSTKVREQIQQGLRSLELLERTPVEVDGRGYVSIHGDWIAIPSAAPLPPDTPPPAGFQDELRAAVDHANHEARCAFQALRRQQDLQDQPDEHAPFCLGAIGEFMQVMSGRLDPRQASADARALAGHGRGRHRIYREAAVAYSRRLGGLLVQPGITIHHLARLYLLKLEPHVSKAFVLLNGSSALAQRLRQLADSAGDLRPVLHACGPAGLSAEDLVSELLQRRYQALGFDSRTQEKLWPVVAEQLGLIDQALGLAPSAAGATYLSVRALELLALLPAPPRRYLPALLERAIRGIPEEKVRARGLLARARGLTEMIIPFLASGERGRRIGAAQWLRERGEPGAIPPVRAALNREKTDIGRAVFLEVLAALGDDVSDQFSEERLLEEAQAGLASTRTQVQRCVPLDHLPALAWADGRPVPPQVVRWWVALADSLKSPRGSPMLHLALDRLEPRGAEQLALLVLSSFVAFDTRRPTEEEANAFAEAGAGTLLQSRRRWRPGFTREQAFAELKARKLAQYLQSALEHRGVLALSRRAPPGEAVEIVQAYMRDHARRTPQCKALLEALAGHPSPLALQFLLGISLRYQTQSVRSHAAVLVDALAAERGWTREELADRTVPMGGLDERGVLKLPCGNSPYTASLSPDLKVVFRNEQRQVIKALPSGEAATVARKRLSQLRKVLQQTVPQQTARLYDAMCAGRIWRPLDVISLFFRHPILGRLCQRLVFAGFDAQDHIIQTFRPLEDGSFTLAADEGVEIAAFAGVRVAHSLLLDDEQVGLWQQHLRDYKIALLFEQLARPRLRLHSGEGDATVITEREGYRLPGSMLDALASTLGYERGPTGEGGWFTSYRKPFLAAGLAAIIDFTGARLGQIQAPCTIKGLRFMRGETVHDSPIPLSSLPPVLLSETWNDLRTIAEASSGLDPDWQT
jgi:hypothetical protein